MKFEHGQKVVCIAEKSEWDNIVPNFDEMLKKCLGVIKVPNKGEICTVNNPFEMHYNGRTYITLKGYTKNNFDERAFELLYEKEATSEEKIKRSISLKQLN